MSPSELMPIADTRREVDETPAALTRALSLQAETLTRAAVELTNRQVDRLILLGSGDSLSAGQAALQAFERCSALQVEAVQAYEFAAYGQPGLDERTALIVISSSGRPTTTWDALNRALASPSYVIGLSDITYPGNPFIEKSHLAIVPGAVKKGWPAQPTTVTTAILIQLAILLGKQRGVLSPEQASGYQDELLHVPTGITNILKECQAPAEKMAEALTGQRLFVFVGGGSGYAAACVGAALWAAGPQLPAVAHEVEEFHHALRVATLAPGDPLILVAPDGSVDSRNLDTARVVKSWGGRLAVLCSPHNHALRSQADWWFTLPVVPEMFSPLYTLPVLQSLSIEFAKQRVAGGYQRVADIPK